MHPNNNNNHPNNRHSLVIIVFQFRVPHVVRSCVFRVSWNRFGTTWIEPNNGPPLAATTTTTTRCRRRRHHHLRRPRKRNPPFGWLYPTKNENGCLRDYDDNNNDVEDDKRNDTNSSVDIATLPVPCAWFPKPLMWNNRFTIVRLLLYWKTFNNHNKQSNRPSYQQRIRQQWRWSGQPQRLWSYPSQLLLQLRRRKQHHPPWSSNRRRMP